MQASLHETHVAALEALARVKTLEALFFVMNEHGPNELPAEETAEAYEALVSLAREQLMRSLGHGEEAFALMLENLGIELPPRDEPEPGVPAGLVEQALDENDALGVRAAQAFDAFEEARALAASITQHVAGLNARFDEALKRSMEALERASKATRDYGRRTGGPT